MKQSTWELPMTHRARNLALLSILILTASLWAGVAGIQMDGVDYQYMEALAPIHPLADIFRPFVVPDPNPSYFRPVANATMALDFFLFGWNGGAFHLTNLFLHLVATALVFFFVRTIFQLPDRYALLATFAFGIAASHESNIVWSIGRTDSLSAIFILLTLLMARRAIDKNYLVNTIAALLSFAVALLSKESAVLALPLIGALYWKSSAISDLKRTTARFFPYAAVIILFYFYHQYFTIPITESQPLTAEGSHSIVALLRNIVFALGYFFVPFDLSTATALMTRDNGTLLAACVVVVILMLWLLIRMRHTGIFRAMGGPFLFTVAMGLVLAFSFERWRLYLPSVGLVGMLAIFVRHLTSRPVRMVCFILLSFLVAFHVYRTLAAESEWRASTRLLDRLKENMSGILASIPKRPLRVGFIVVPAKLGSAPVLQLGTEAVLRRAEADRLNAFNHETASTVGVNVEVWTAVNVYALDPSEGFRNLVVTQIATDRYLVSASLKSSMILYPANLTTNVVARRDRVMAVDDSVVTPECVAIVRAVESGMAKSIEVHVRDTAATLISFNHENVFERIR
jgi:Dolichyl-phosphate-mannose-protein mannosyltransferase